MRVRPLLLLLLVLAVPIAVAHGDRVVAPEGTAVEIAPGEAAILPFQAHYHRLVGRIEPASGQALRASVERVADDARIWESGVIDAPRGVNALLPCCDGATWSDLRVVLRGARAGEPVSATLALEAVHDDFIIAGEGKEGAIYQTPLLFGVGAALLARGGYRAWRAPLAPAPAGALRLSAALTVAVVLAAFVAGAWGAARFGGSRIEGFLAAAGTLSPWWGSVSGFLALLVPWTLALVWWMRAYRGAVAGGPRAGVVLVGAMQALATAGLPLFFGASYGATTLTTTAWALWPAAAVQLGLLAALSRRRAGAAWRDAAL